MDKVSSWAAGLCPVVRGALTGKLALVAGDNKVTTPVSNPRGRVTVFQDAASTLIDGAATPTTWVVNASAPCNAIFLFF
jgi:hypothetical protein